MNAASAQALAAQHGTPLYAYDLSVVDARAAELQAALPAGAVVCYSFKANPLPAIARRARTHGCLAEVTSVGEIAAAQTAGFNGAEMLFGGPGKTTTVLDTALRSGIRWFSCESFRDLTVLSEACGRHGAAAHVLLRVNPAEAPAARLAMTGVESQFGFAEPLLLEPGARAKVELPHLRVEGVHVYFGTQVAGVQALVDNTRRALECAQRVEAALGLECQVVNAGGGFPWPYASAVQPPSLDGLREGITEIWETSAIARRGGCLWFESGRWLCASSGWLLARVLEVKHFPSRIFVILDTGIHHLGGMAGLGRVPRPALSVRNFSLDAAAEAVVCADLVGPLCTPLDCLARGLKIPPVEAGDLVGIPNVGAYGLTASLHAFLSHPAPAEVVHENGRCTEVWRLRSGHECVMAAP